MPKREGFTGTDTGAMTLPKMDAPSVMFAHLLDAVYVEAGPLEDEVDPPYYLTCRVCAERICEVSDGDTMRVLLNTALQHKCDL